MPPRLVLDANLSTALARALAQRGLDVVHIAQWQEGRWRTVDDETLLQAALTEARVLVSLDASTLPGTARQWGEDGRDHAGILLLSARLRQDDIGGQVAGVMAALDDWGEQPWTNVLLYGRRRR